MSKKLRINRVEFSEAIRAFGGCEAIDSTFLGEASDGNLSYCKELFSEGADINAENQHGDTALHLLAHKRHDKYLAMARWLLENGADIKAKNNGGATPLIECAKSGDAIEMATLFISKGASLRVRDKSGETALGWAQIVDGDSRRDTSELTQLLEEHTPERKLPKVI